MTAYSTAQIWIIILAMGLGTFAIRFSFLGLFGDRKLPKWAMDHLRYTPVAILPGLVAPLLMETGADGALQYDRLIAAAATVGVGLYARNTLAAVGAGAAVLTVLTILA